VLSGSEQSVHPVVALSGTAMPMKRTPWHPVIRAALGSQLDELAVDFLAVGLCFFAPTSVQVSNVLFFEGEVHEDQSTLRSHCASLIAVWGAARAPSVIDLGECVCVGKRMLLLPLRHGRRFAVHAVPLHDGQAVFGVISSSAPWVSTERAKVVVQALTDQVQELNLTPPTESAAPTRASDSALNWFMFTAREIEILKLLAQGMSNKQIARELGSSPNTIRNQIHAVFRKAAVTNRTELALRASRLVT
jgi:DNA-binding CsgD family transcriptional regulator